jgi:hypothetical protein
MTEPSGCVLLASGNRATNIAQARKIAVTPAPTAEIGLSGALPRSWFSIASTLLAFQVSKAFKSSASIVLPSSSKGARIWR